MVGLAVLNFLNPNFAEILLVFFFLIFTVVEKRPVLPSTSYWVGEKTTVKKTKFSLMIFFLPPKSKLLNLNLLYIFRANLFFAKPFKAYCPPKGHAYENL